MLSIQVGQVSVWISDMVRFKNISLEGINVNLFDCTSVLEKLTSTTTVAV